MKMKFLAPFLAALSCLFLCTTVWAQGPASSAEEEKSVRAARKLFDEGLAAQQVDDLKKAYEAFRQSFNLRPSYDTAANLGHVEIELGRLVDAATHLEYCIRTFPTGENESLFQLAKGLYDETIPKVTSLTLVVDVAGASVFRDGKLMGTTPIPHPLFTEPGRAHTIRVEAKDGRTGSVEFEGRAGEVLDLEVSLQNEEAPRPASGLHEEKSPTNNVPSNDPEPTRQKKNWVPAYVLGGVTVAALGTSVVFKVAMGAKRKDAEDLQDRIPEGACAGEKDSDCTNLSKAVETHNTYRTIANTSLVVSGVAAAATASYVIYTILKKDDPERRRIGASAWVDQSGGQLLLHGSF